MNESSLVAEAQVPERQDRPAEPIPTQGIVLIIGPAQPGSNDPSVLTRKRESYTKQAD